MLIPVLQDATVLTLTALVCTCIATMVGSSITSILAYMKSRDNGIGLIQVNKQGNSNSKKLDDAGSKLEVLHDISNHRFDELSDTNKNMRAEIKDLREELNKLLGTVAGQSAARIQSGVGLTDHGHGPDTLHVPHDREADPRRVDPPRTGL